MQIIYKEINTELLEKIAVYYGEWAKNHIHLEEGSYSLVALHNDNPIGFISAYTKSLTEPLKEERDAYIDVIEVDKPFQRQGIATELINRTEKWAQREGFSQIRAWSSQDKTEAIPMWHALEYCMCPAKIWIEWCNEAVDGYYVVKQLNPSNEYKNIAKRIKRDISINNANRIRDLHLLRAKAGIYVYKCTYNNISAVVKYFEKEEDKREIRNYRILIENGIPTINVLAFRESSIVMEDIDLSNDWRLGVAEDMQDIEVAKGLAHWYFNFHEKGAAVPELSSLYCEYDSVTEASIEALCERLPEAADTFRYILLHYHKLRELIDMPSYTLTYNDFYYTNFIVRKDKQAALMFDYNLLGRGYRYSDMRNVDSLSEEAYKVFCDEYHRLYFLKYESDRADKECFEEKIDNVVSTLFSLITAYDMEHFPDWAREAKNDVLDGTLLIHAKKLLGRINN